MFNKIFGSGVDREFQPADITKGMSTTDIKTDIILGALRNILLVCEICKPKLKTLRDPQCLDGRGNFFQYADTK